MFLRRMVVCKTYHNTVGHGELDCGSGGFSARCGWQTSLPKSNVEILELFTRTGEEVMALRQTPSVVNTHTHTPHTHT